MTLEKSPSSIPMDKYLEDTVALVSSNISSTAASSVVGTPATLSDSVSSFEDLMSSNNTSAAFPIMPSSASFTPSNPVQLDQFTHQLQIPSNNVQISSPRHVMVGGASAFATTAGDISNSSLTSGHTAQALMEAIVQASLTADPVMGGTAISNSVIATVDGQLGLGLLDSSAQHSAGMHGALGHLQPLVPDNRRNSAADVMLASSLAQQSTQNAMIDVIIQQQQQLHDLVQKTQANQVLLSHQQQALSNIAQPSGEVQASLGIVPCGSIYQAGLVSNLSSLQESIGLDTLNSGAMAIPIATTENAFQQSMYNESGFHGLNIDAANVGAGSAVHGLLLGELAGGVGAQVLLNSAIHPSADNENFFQETATETKGDTTAVQTEVLEKLEEKQCRIAEVLENISAALAPEATDNATTVEELTDHTNILEDVNKAKKLVDEQVAVIEQILTPEGADTNDNRHDSTDEYDSGSDSDVQLEEDDHDERDTPAVDVPAEKLLQMSKTELIKTVLTFQEQLKELQDPAERRISPSSESIKCQWENCVEVCDDSESLTQHLVDKHVHCDDEGYICRWENCRRLLKPFSKKTRLTNHFRTHSGEKPFVCPLEGCNKRFGRADALKTHALVHSRSKPHVCEVSDCQKAFYHRRSLVKHISESHEGYQMRKRIKLSETRQFDYALMPPDVPMSEILDRFSTNTTTNTTSLYKNNKETL